MPAIVIHPGEHLAEELRGLGMSAAELARRLNVPTNRITEILNRRRGITGDTALRLAHFFGTTAEFWLNLQSLYEIRLADHNVDYLFSFQLRHHPTHAGRTRLGPRVARAY